MSGFNAGMLTGYAIGFGIGLLGVYYQRRLYRTAIAGWQNARDGWADTLRTLADTTGIVRFHEMADDLDNDPVAGARPAPDKLEPNPGLQQGPRHRIDAASDAEAAEKLARGYW